VVRDRRRIDPETGEVRPPSPDTGFGAPEPEVAATPDEVLDAPPNQEAELKAQLDERTADLQRLQAEYANYRKRIDRDREVVVNTAKASVAAELLSVLDDIERASQHGDLTGAFKAVADKLVATLERTGLEAFGHGGETFDPSVHEAVQHDTSPDVTGPTVTAVLRRGYRFGDRVLRAALVAVTDHEPAPEPVVVDAVEEKPAAEESVDESSMPSSTWYDPNNPDGREDEQQI
jgi:molecular chaperone GrpE